MATIEWRKQDNQVNGYNGIDPIYRIRKSFFGFGSDYVVQSSLSKVPNLPEKAYVTTIDDGKKWAEEHRAKWHAAVDAWRNRGEPA